MKNNREENITKVYLYPKDVPEDLIKLNEIKKIVWNFFDEGYRYAGLDGFKRSCLNANSLKKNTNLLKLIYYNDVLIASSIYSARDGGYKCVGITATTNETYRKLGVKYVHYIVEEDIMNYSNFFWTICSGSLERIYEQHGGIKIPNEYIPAFKLLIDYEIVTDDEYAISVKLNDGDTYRKTIYGFNSKDALESALAERDERIISRINRIKERNKLHENTKYNHIRLTDVEQSIAVINIFYEERCNGMDDLTDNLMNILTQNIDIIKSYVEKNIYIDKNERDKCLTAIENGFDVLDSSTIIKIYH